MAFDNPSLRSPEKIKQIIEEALSPVVVQQGTGSDHSSPEDSAVTPTSDLTDEPLQLQTAEGVNTAAHDVFTNESDSLRKVDQWEFSPLLARPLQSGQLSSPFRLSNTPTPSPLRCVTNYNSISSSSPETSPIQPRDHRGVDVNDDAAFLSSPIRPLNTSTATKTFEVEASFLQAMVRLLERQANTVPEHLFTKTEVKDIVRKELGKQKGCSDTEVPRRKKLSGLIGPSETVAMMLGGVSIVVLLRVHESYPWWTHWFIGGACRGAVYGFLGAMAIKSAFWGVDGLRRV
jgi:hypothetical protein